MSNKQIASQLEHRDISTTFGRTEQQSDVSGRTRAEHNDLLVAMHQLEVALGSPAPRREVDWAKRVIGTLELVDGAVRAHAASVESENGLYAELLLARPEMALSRIEKLRLEHQELLRRSAALSNLLNESERIPDFVNLRRQAAELLLAIRHHQAQEADLIFECFWTDIGCGD